MKENKEIVKGSVVRYKDGWVRVTAKFKNTVNLGGVFNGRIYHRAIPLTEVFEDHDAWYDNWSQSESYQCM